MQNWQRRPSDGFVLVNVPITASHLYVNGVAYMTQMDGEQRICWMTPMDALDLLGSTAAASSMPFIEANRPLLAQLQERAKVEGYVPRNKIQGVRVHDILQAAEDAKPKTLMQQLDEIHRFKWGIQ